MREVRLSDECLAYIEISSDRVKKKFAYLLTVLQEQKIVHSSIVEKLVNTDYYELKIKTNNQIRIILFTIDHSDFNQCEKVILLNGFMKKTNKDYKKAIETANILIEKYL